MVIDYKHVTFSFKDQKRKRRLRNLKIALFVILVVSLIFLIHYIQKGKKIYYIQELLLKGNQTEALEQYKNLSKSPPYADSIQELEALILLIDGDAKSAKPLLKKLGRAKTSLYWERFLNHFIEQAKYEELKIYADYLLGKNQPAQFYKALALAATFKYREAEELLSRIPPAQAERFSQAIDLLSNLNSRMKNGKVDFVFDRNGKPLAYFDLKSRKTVSLTPGMTFEQFGTLFERGIKTFTLSLDLSIQQKVSQIFRKHHGSMIVINTMDSGIAAAFSKPRNRMKTNTVFTAEYEPGSIIKILTLFAFFQNPDPGLFPMKCLHSIRLSNRDFPDRAAHGTIENPQFALVISCNIAFARMGLNVGFKPLSKVLKSFYFNSGGFKDQFIEFKTGNFNPGISNDFQLANLAVGLNEITVTTFHSAFMAMAVAANGSLNRPYLINNIKNILNLGYYNHSPELLHVFRNSPNYLKISQAMVDVVENRHGTGWHSRLQSLKAAIKTGTAGDKKSGLNAIIIGFFPAEKPEFAFAFILEGAGTAMFKGANLLKDFLRLMQDQFR
jgi:hypothetical protein